MKNLLGVVLIVTTSFSAFTQGRVDGFLKGKGNLDIAVGTNVELNERFYAGNNLIDLSRTIVSANTFFAYGIANNLDVNVSIPFVSVNVVENNLQDVALFLKYQFTQLKLADGKKGKINFLIAGGFSSNITNYETEGGSAIGQQAKVLDIRPVIHYQTNSGFFTTLQGGYNYKFDPVPDAAVFAAKIGLAKANWYADLWYDGQIGRGGLDYLGIPAPASFRELGVDYHKIGGTFYKPVKERLGIYGGASYVLDGRNISKGIGFSLGLVFKPNVKRKNKSKE